METTCSGSFAVAQAGLPGIVTRVRERRTVLCVALPVKAGRPNVKAGRPNAPHGGLPAFVIRVREWHPFFASRSWWPPAGRVENFKYF